MRLLAIEGLGKLGDPDVVPIIANAAASDPYDRSEEIRKLGGKPDKPSSYPVREEAKEIGISSRLNHQGVFKIEHDQGLLTVYVMLIQYRI